MESSSIAAAERSSSDGAGRPLSSSGSSSSDSVDEQLSFAEAASEDEERVEGPSDLPPMFSDSDEPEARAGSGDEAPPRSLEQAGRTRGPVDAYMTPAPRRGLPLASFTDVGRAGQGIRVPPTAFKEFVHSNGGLGMLSDHDENRGTPHADVLLDKQSVKRGVHAQGARDKELFDLKLKVFFLEKTLQEYQDKRDPELVRENVKLKTDLASLYAEFRRLQSEKMLSEKRSLRQNTSMEAYTSRIADLEAQVRSLEADMTEAGRESNALRNYIAKLQTLYAEGASGQESAPGDPRSSDLVSRLETEIDMRNEHIEDLESQLENLVTAINSVEDPDRRKYYESLDRQTLCVYKLSQEKRQLSEAYRQAMLDRDVLDEYVDRLAREKSDADVTLDEYRRQLDDLKMLRDVQVPELEGRVRELEGENAKLETVQAELDTCVAKLDTARNELAALREANSKLDAELAAATTARATMEDENAAFQRDLQDLMTNFKQYEQERANEQNIFAEQRDKISQESLVLRTRIDELEAQAVQYAQDLQRIKAERDTAEKNGHDQMAALEAQVKANYVSNEQYAELDERFTRLRRNLFSICGQEEGLGSTGGDDDDAVVEQLCERQRSVNFDLKRYQQHAMAEEQRATAAETAVRKADKSLATLENKMAEAFKQMEAKLSLRAEQLAATEKRLSNVRSDMRSLKGKANRLVQENKDLSSQLAARPFVVREGERGGDGVWKYRFDACHEELLTTLEHSKRLELGNKELSNQLFEEREASKSQIDRLARQLRLTEEKTEEFHRRLQQNAKT